MRYLLDTCVLSEFMKTPPDSKVVRWIGQCDEESLLISVLTFGELQKGISKLGASARKRKLQDWLDHELRPRFRDRLISITDEVACRWGQIAGGGESAGQPIPAIDGLLAATALTHDLAVATRNTTGMRRCGVRVVNPWSD